MILLIACLLMSCKKDTSLNSDYGPLPIVTILSPTNDTTYYADVDSITINIVVTSESAISKVQVIIDSLIVHEFSAAPFTYTWKITSISGSGQHTIYANAQNQKGAMGISQAVKVNINDPNPISNVMFSSPLSDNISAKDSIYLEVTGANGIYNSLIKRIQIYVDSVLVHEYNPPPMGVWWVFKGLQDNTVHSVYAKAYDWRNRSGQSPPKTFTAHITPPPRQSTYSPILSVGNKWYYQYASGTTDAFIIREIVDTTSDGWRNVSIKAIYKDTTKTRMEYWKNIDGNFYILTYFSNYSTQNAQPIYIPKLTKDSSASNSSNYYSWKITNFVFAGKTYSTQNALIGIGYISKGINETTYGFSNEIGLVKTYNRYGLYILPFTEESATLKGVQLNGVLFGDSTNTIQ